MRTDLPASQADQHLKRAGRSKARHQGSRRRHLARQLHALRSRILRPGAENPATSRQPVRHEVVTHVLGTTCHLCVRAGQWVIGALGGIRTPDPQIRSLVLYPAELRAPTRLLAKTPPDSKRLRTVEAQRLFARAPRHTLA